MDVWHPDQDSVIIELYREVAIPARAIVTKELAELLGAVAHPHRIRIVIELREQELDVNSIQRILNISHSAVSQNLAILRTHRLVQERREGRHVYYSLVNKSIALWLLQGIDFLEGGLSRTGEMLEALESARGLWHEAGT